MLRHLTHRLLQGLVVLAAMSFVIYALIGLMPGDPIDLMISANPQLTPADAERLRGIHGLNRPIVERFRGAGQITSASLSQVRRIRGVSGRVHRRPRQSLNARHSARFVRPSQPRTLS